MAKRRAEELEARHAGVDGIAACSSNTNGAAAKRGTTSQSPAPLTALSYSTENGAMMRSVDVKAFGLEDRAEAVIALGNNSWSLAHLAKWRSDALATATDNSSASPVAAERTDQQSERAYLRQRQRAYMKQCLAGTRSSDSSNSSNSDN